jgi:hypothetical protein
MKRLITIIFITLLISSAFGQNDKPTCYALRVANKKYLSDTLLLQPKLYLQGFYVVKNGVYDLKVNDKEYYYQRILKITKDSIYAAYVFDTIPTLKFSNNDKISIYLTTCYDGRCGFPVYTKIEKKKYEFKILETKDYFSFKALEVCSNKDCEFKYLGFQYLTGSGLVLIYRKDGEDYVVLGSQTVKITRPK